MKEYGVLLDKNISVDDNESLTVKMKNKEVLLEKVLYNNLDNEEKEFDTYIENISLKRNHLNYSFDLGVTDLSSYNRFHVSMNIKCRGYVNFYVHFSIVNNGKHITHTQSVRPNIDDDIIWELNKEKLDKVTKIEICVFVMGTPPEGINKCKCVVNYVKAQKVKAEYEEGWDIEDRIAFSHIGYLVGMEKKALIKDNGESYFELINGNNEVVYRGDCIKKGVFLELNFSDFNNTGQYKIKCGEKTSKSFAINNNIYDESILKSLHFYKSLRCGEYVEGVHSPCHLYSKTVHPVTGQTVPDFGGWHDAGDLSQFEICTAEMTSSLCDLALSLKDGDLKQRVIEESYIGANWLLRTRFNDGYRANLVLYRTWHSNVLNSDDTSVKYNEAEEGPFENFIASEALSKMYLICKDECFREWCLDASINDFYFAIREYDNGIYTKRWGKSMDSQTGGALLSAASSLYKATNDDKYLEVAGKYVQKVLATQETDVSKDLYGYFYEDKEHKYILSYEHRGHDQSPICGIVSFYEVCKDSVIKDLLFKHINLYRDFIIKSFAIKNNCYNLLPANVYNVNMINIDHFTTYGYDDKLALETLQKQVVTGVKLDNDMYLRNFPISLSRRGFHATLLSKAKGVSSVARVLKDKLLKQIAAWQIEWVLGYNPFASSTMYGLGYNFHPLYVAFSKQMVGALPVGIMTYENNDAPFWPVKNKSVYKEIWGHTTGKFLWVIADIIGMERENE